MADAELARASSQDQLTYDQVAKQLGLPIEVDNEDDILNKKEPHIDLALIDEKEEEEEAGE